MSWMKRPQAGVPPPGPEPQLYGASQQFANQQNMYPNYQGGAPGNLQQQQQYWQMPQQQQQQQPQYNQQYGQVYQQPDYGNNANQFYQQPTQYNQNFSNQGYTNPQQVYQQNYYPNQGAQQQSKVNVKSDGWEDNWDWGWEDSSKQAQNAIGQNITLPSLTSQPQPQMFNNANVIEESFASTDSWNWAMEDKKENKEQIALPATSAPSKHESKEPILSSSMIENITTNESSVQQSSNNLPVQQPTEEVKTLSDRDAVKERLPNLALGKRFNIDNLTPQWSIESQMSQESSDGPQTHSESTYRSENQSRNSSKSSPGLNTDNSNFNYSQSGIDDLYPHSSEWSRHSTDEVTLVDNLQTNSSRRESHDELSSSLQEMSIANCENPTPDSLQARKELESKNTQEIVSPLQPPPSQSPANFPPPPASTSLPSPPSLSSGSMPPPPPVTSSTLPPPPPSSLTLPPPSNFPTSTSSQNPFKHAGPFSHKSKGSGSTSSNHSLPPQMSSTNLTSPTVVNKVSQHRIPGGFSANLETTPDNSERPDQPQASTFRPQPVTQQMPDNLEVAPKNDRNEYLQTAHLSSGDYGENTDFSCNIPPPGLRRMVVGQQESEYNQNLNMSGDEPPPGLARMVPGQHTEVDNSYNQSSDNYMDRHIDGQPTTGSARPYRQADGQQTPDNYTQPPSNRGNERRPIGLDRMVPGKPSNNEYTQYQGSSFGNSNEQRVVTGVDHDYSIPTEAGPSDIREQNVDGSDYTDHRNTQRNIIGARETSVDPSPDFSAALEEQQREIIMEGENLQDLSTISSTELTFSREQTLEGADMNVNDAGTDRKTDASDSIDHPSSNSRRQSLNRVNTSGDDSERARTYKSSPRRDRDKNKSSRDRDRDGRYSRDDRKYDRESERRSGREDRRTEKDRRDRDRDRDRRDRDDSPDTRRHKRSIRSHRYETEDTDYYSDRERDRRRYRESSSKPPRPDDKDRRYDDRDRRSTRRYNTIERDRRYDDERDGGSRRDRHRDRDRYEMRYRDIDPTRKHGNLRREQEDRRRVVTFSGDAKTNDNSNREGESYSSPSRPDSREAARTDDDLAEGGEPRRATHARRSHRRHHPDPYYGYSGGYADPYLAQQQYQYYEQLRRTDPAAYIALYKRLMAGQPPPSQDYIAAASLTAPLYGDGYASLGYEGRAEGRGSVHSGRSSANGLKGTDTYYGSYRHDVSSLRDAPSLRTDLSDRDLNTDASLNLHLEDSTVRSERMTPFKFSTAHIKGSISSRHIVLVRPSYPVDGLPATVHVYSLAAALANDPLAAELAQYPGPLVKGVTHKKSVIEYCESRVRGAARAAGGDRVGYVLLWELLALLLRQNGVVVGTDIAELLMKNKREYEMKTSKFNESRRGSSVSAEGRDEELRNSSPDQLSTATSDITPREDPGSPRPAVDEKAALDRLREYLTFGNRHEALESAMSSGLWGHALTLAAHGERRARLAVAARFLASLPRADPLHTLYAALAARQPPAATCVSDERWGDWRPHCAMLLANSSGRAEQDRRTLTQLGDTLAGRGLLYCAQFCYVAAGVPFQRHPLAPLAPATPADLAASSAPAASAPRLPLLLADPRADSLGALATNQAIFATEIYEYALSLNQDYVITELQVYKLVLASRLVDVGQYERALAYAEQAARAVTRAPADYSPALIHHLAELADRLKYHDPALQEDPSLMDEATGGESGEPSPRHHQQWLDDVKSVAHSLTAAATLSQQSTPQHYIGHEQQQPSTYGWHEQMQQPYQQTSPTYADPAPAEETPDYAAQYYAQQQLQQQYEQQPPEQQPPSAPYGEQWPAAAATAAAQYEPHAHSYADPYWQQDSPYAHAEGGGGAGSGAGGGVADGAGDEEPRPMITMPGSAGRSPLYDDFDDDRPPSAEQMDRETDTPKSSKQSNKQQGKSKEDGKGKNGSGSGGSGGWFGGILNKLTLRAPNQMILPDDKNPTIVWDAEHKRWRNLDGDEDAVGAPPPPPTGAQLAAHLAAHAQQTAPASALQAPPAAPPAAPVSNIFKMQKGRHIKKSYVDVFNPSGAPTRPLPPPADVLGPAAPVAPAPAYFVPQQAVIKSMRIVHVPMPPSPAASPPATPRLPALAESGIYEPSQAANDDDNYHSGI